MCWLRHLLIPQGWTLAALVLIADLMVDWYINGILFRSIERMRVIMAMRVGAVKVIIQ